MSAFTTLSAIALPLRLANVDTDKIYPARFMNVVKYSAGYERYLFHDLRFDEDGVERADFIMNRAPYRKAKILVASENFGCGSSRETAVWALVANHYRVVVASSFGEIFRVNCVKNGILPVALSEETVDRLQTWIEDSPGRELEVNLESQTVAAGNSVSDFKIDAFQKQSLLSGLDEIDLTLTYSDTIAQFEGRVAIESPWVYRKRA